MTPPDPTTFAFFKGIDDAGNGKGLLQAVVIGGLPVGVYRVCTMIAARNHQPVNMALAHRGAQDDCTKFEVVEASRTSTVKTVPTKKNSGNADSGKIHSGKVDGKARDQNGFSSTAAATGTTGVTQGGTLVKSSISNCITMLRSCTATST